MDERILKLTPAEFEAYNVYNAILKACMGDFKSTYQIQRLGVKYIKNTVLYKCHHLVEHGYLDKGKQITEPYNQKNLVFKTIKPEYDLDEFILFCEAKKRRARLIEKGRIVEKKAHVPSPGARVLNMDEIEAKQMETMRLERLRRKSPKVYVGTQNYSAM